MASATARPASRYEGSPSNSVIAAVRAAAGVSSEARKRWHQAVGPCFGGVPGALADTAATTLRDTLERVGP
jgi:hypothetical protein